MTAVEAAPTDPRTARPWSALIALCIGFFMILLDTTIVNIAIPTMMNDLHASLNEIIWVNSIYLLTYAVPLLFTARLGDRFGPKRLFLVGLVVFTAASLWCGLSSDVAPLIAARALQGLGAAAMMPQTLAFITHLFPRNRRGAAMGLWGGVAGLATVGGPLLGGALVEAFDWESIFFINVPVGVVAVVLVLRLVPDWQPRHSHRFDPLGIGLSTVGLAALVFGLQEGERYDWGTIWGPVTVPVLIGAGLLFIGGFVLWQRKNRSEPLLPLGIFGFRNFSASSLANVALGFTLTGMFLPLVIYLQAVRGYSTLVAGLVVAPLPLASGVTSAIAGKLSDRLPGRRIATTGFVVFAIGVALIALALRPDTSLAILLPIFALTGLGMGCTFAPLAQTATQSLPPRLIGTGSGVFNTFRQVGGVIGSAAIGVLLQARVAIELPAAAAVQAQELPAPYRVPFVDGFAEAAGSTQEFGGTGPVPLPPGVPADVAEHVRELGRAAFDHGFTAATRTTLLLPAVVLLLGALACLLIRRADRQQTP